LPSPPRFRNRLNLKCAAGSGFTKSPIVISILPIAKDTADLGSQWLSTVERKAKLPVREDLSNAERCERIQQLLQRRTFIINRALGLDISF
jgi:hypothetical protein